MWLWSRPHAGLPPEVTVTTRTVTTRSVKTRRRRVLMSVLAVAVLLGGYAVAMPAAAAIPQAITFPLNVSRSVIESQGPETWCYWRGDSCHHDYNAADIF